MLAAEDPSTYPIELAEASESDCNYVRSTWLMSNRKSRWHEGISSDIYYKAQSRIVNNLIETAYVVVARWREHTEQLYGWVCYDTAPDKNVIHYCYVGAKYRKLGIGRALVQIASGRSADIDVIATHYSHATDDFLKNRMRITYNPYLLRPEIEHEDF